MTILEKLFTYRMQTKAVQKKYDHSLAEDLSCAGLALYPLCETEAETEKFLPIT